MPSFSIKTLTRNYSGIIEKHLNILNIEEDYQKAIYLQPGLSAKDYMWSLYNRMLLITNENLGEFYLKQHALYSSMSGFVPKYEGKDGMQYSKLAVASEMQMHLFEAENSKNIFWEVEIIGHPKCNAGMKYDGVKYPLDGSVTALPIGGEECSLGSCGCTTARISKRDEKGKLIFRE